ncbi:hypothetical protein KGF56_003541 [Candida oxycetoniae]|uniref:Cysteine proteinase 1, mitochondrial n=1 Tax=Candida oxycetoniae TaxID=497107 RepID=A0AAI9SVQ6_9ASCO|nr:uncharacterized protein KGF56_003541 [Candida oxycetoniae]KAI3403614.1 hypothetical protein KGF56_003541 [Candida oxycetoniae]
MQLFRSKPADAQEPERSDTTEVVDEDFSEYFKGIELISTDNDEVNPISSSSLANWESSLLAQPKNILARNVLSQTDIEKVIAKSDQASKLKDRFLFNTTVSTIGSPAFQNNQKSSGRCWIFAASNVFRTSVIKNYSLKEDEFQISQSYLFFYDKLEKANFFLDNIEATAADEPLDSRLTQHLLHDPVGDGGQWDMIINLVNKYGLVPHEVFPDNFQTTKSAGLNKFVTNNLRHYALKLRELVVKGASKSSIKTFKQGAVQEVYKILALTIGIPPKPSDEFVWEFLDKDGKYKHFKTNALDFYKTHVKYDAAAHFSLIHDPRNKYDELYTVDKLNNITGGKPIEYVNTEIEEIKNVAIKMLKDNEPIFFGSDVGKFGDRVTGVLDTTAYDYQSVFDVDSKLDKAQRLEVGASQMTHAMVITGVHIDPSTNKPVRWKIENSWGENSGNKGWYMMTDEWFDEYVYQIVSNKKYVTKKTFDVWKAKEFNVLPYYDPMGSLA